MTDQTKHEVLIARDGNVLTPKIVRATSRYLVGVEEG